MPKKLSALSSVFLRSGSFECQVTGSKKFSCDLPQGELEISCKYIFSGKSIKIKKFRDVIKEVYDKCKKGKAANEVDGVVEVTGGTEGEELSDLHINACQTLLESRFPTILGFCSTLNFTGSSLDHWVPNYITGEKFSVKIKCK